MGVAIDETGHHHPPGRIDFLAVVRQGEVLDTPAEADLCDPPILNQQSAVANNR
jgi:hypothetical protein